MTYAPPTPEEFRALLEAWGLTGERAAALSGLHGRRQIHRYTSGQTKVPYAVLYTLARECAALRLTPETWREVMAGPT